MKKIKNAYETPLMQVLHFDAKDIITTSGFAGGELPLGPRGASSILDDIF